MILRVTQYGEPILREPGQPVETFDESIKQLSRDMIDTMYEQEGIGLAAQQIGKAVCICVVDVRPPDGYEPDFEYLYDGKTVPLDLIMPLVIINPEIEVLDETEEVYDEGCLSFPNITGNVDRPTRILCRFVDTDGSPHTIEADGLLGRCIQHEFDHLEGKLFIDRMYPRDLRKNESKIKRLKRDSRDFLKGKRSS